MKTEETEIAAGKKRRFGKRRYDAGKLGTPRTSGWLPLGDSPTSSMRMAIGTIRDRSVDMYDNNPTIKSAIDKIATLIAGGGIRPSVDVSGIKNKAASRRAEQAVLAAWNDWTGSIDCDFDGDMPYYPLQVLIARAVAMQGECIVRKRYSQNSTGVPLQVQVQGGAFIDSNQDGITLPNGNYITLGIEFNSTGKRVAYWLFDRHPQDATYGIASATSRRVEAKDVIHVYYKEKPGQIRGVPFGTTMLLKARDLNQFQDTMLIKQKVSAMFAGFVIESDGAADDEGLESEDGEPIGPIDYDNIEPGAVVALPPGSEIEFANPPTVEGAESFVRDTKRDIAAGLGITYELISADYSKTNFSSARMGALSMLKQIADWQGNMMLPINSRVWEWFMEAAFIAGKVSLQNKGLKAQWTAPKPDMIDPLKEVKALQLMVENGFLSYSEALRKLGQDPDDVFEEIQSDMAKATEMGITIPSPKNSLQSQGKHVSSTAE